MAMLVDQNQINEVIKYKEKKENMSVEVLDSEPGFYQFVIRPMLLPGHEGELCTWLKEMGLMQRTLRCVNGIKNPTCNLPMKWTPARIIDKYQWTCNQCSSKRPIRENSFFKNTKLSLRDNLRIMLGWCKDMSVEDMADVLAVKHYMVRQVFRKCADVADSFVRSHYHDYKIGGPEVVVLVDLYPDGCAKAVGSFRSSALYQTNNSVPILCIAEAKMIPTRFWFHIIHNADTKEEALNIVQKIVRPGSILVADPDAKVCNCDDLRSLSEYPTVISIDDLARHDGPDKKLLIENLATIWEPAVRVCEEAQRYPRSEVQFYLHNYLWRQRFGGTPSTAMESIIHQIADIYPSVL